MGGYGSGRRGYKQTAEDCRSLDVNRLHREGCLQAGRAGNWVWSRDGREVARIAYRVTDTALILDYRYRTNGSQWEPIEETVLITRTGCNYGGTRPYFCCPGIKNGRHCGRRVGKLFSGGRYFLCRHCYDVAYASQSERNYDRALRRANNLRMVLGGEPGTAHWIAPKPKGMWWRTYENIFDEIQSKENVADVAFLQRYAHCLSDEERRSLFGIGVGDG